MYEHRIVTQPNLSIIERSGREGPRHDPYGWTEFEVIRNGNKVIHRSGGLGYDRLIVNGRTIIELFNYNATDRETIDIYFAMLTGHSLRDWRKASELLEEHRHKCCSQCGSTHFKTARGYPGESFTVCARCSHVIDSDMDYGAIE